MVGRRPMTAMYAVILLVAFAYLPLGIDMLFWTLHANVTADSHRACTTTLKSSRPSWTGSATASHARHAQRRTSTSRDRPRH